MCWPGVADEMLDNGAGTARWNDQISLERAKRADPVRSPREVLLRGSLLLIIVAPAEEHSGTKCQKEFELDEVRGLLETKTRSSGE